MDEIFVGRTHTGEKVYVSAELRRQPGEWQTVTHETVTAPLTLAFQGTVVRKGGSIRRESDWLAGGQIDRSFLRRIVTAESGWRIGDTRKLADVWDEWHLNTLQAGCAHQPPESVVYRQGRYGREIDLDNTPACAETGYKYGSAWLARVLPDDVAVWVSERFGMKIPE